MFLWHFFHRNHDSCSTVTFLEPPQESCLYGAYVDTDVGIKKELYPSRRCLRHRHAAAVTNAMLLPSCRHCRQAGRCLRPAAALPPPPSPPPLPSFCPRCHLCHFCRRFHCCFYLIVDCCLCPHHCCHRQCLHHHRSGARWQHGGGGGCLGHARQRRIANVRPPLSAAFS